MPKRGFGKNFLGGCKQLALGQSPTMMAAVAGAPPPVGGGAVVFMVVVVSWQWLLAERWLNHNNKVLSIMLGKK